MIRIAFLLTFLLLGGCAHTATNAPFCIKPLPESLSQYDCGVQKKEKKKALKKLSKEKQAEEAEKQRLLDIQKAEEQYDEESVNDFFKNFYAESGAHNPEVVEKLLTADIQKEIAKRNGTWDWSEKDRLREEEDEWEEDQRRAEEERNREDEIDELDAYRQSIQDMIDEDEEEDI